MLVIFSIIIITVLAYNNNNNDYINNDIFDINNTAMCKLCVGYTKICNNDILVQICGYRCNGYIIHKCSTPNYFNYIKINPNYID